RGLATPPLDREGLEPGPEGALRLPAQAVARRLARPGDDLPAAGVAAGPGEAPRDVVRERVTGERSGRTGNEGRVAVEDRAEPGLGERAGHGDLGAVGVAGEAAIFGDDGVERAGEPLRRGPGARRRRAGDGLDDPAAHGPRAGGGARIVQPARAPGAEEVRREVPPLVGDGLREDVRGDGPAAVR